MSIMRPPGGAGQTLDLATAAGPSELVMDVVRAIGALQPVWVDGGHSLRWASMTADAFRATVTARTLPHHVHALWLLEAALEWAERDPVYGEPPRYLSPDECGWCHTHTWVAGLCYVSADDVAAVAAMRAEQGQPAPRCQSCGVSYA